MSATKPLATNRAPIRSHPRGIRRYGGVAGRRLVFGGWFRAPFVLVTAAGGVLRWRVWICLGW
jgi:hypothetical protein